MKDKFERLRTKGGKYPVFAVKYLAIMKVVAIVGMNGSGKSEVARVFEQKGFVRIRFGDLTDIEVGKRGLEINEENERLVRQQLRKEHGMAAYAKLNIPTFRGVS